MEKIMDETMRLPVEPLCCKNCGSIQIAKLVKANINSVYAKDFANPYECLDCGMIFDSYEFASGGIA